VVRLGTADYVLKPGDPEVGAALEGAFECARTLSHRVARWGAIADDPRRAAVLEFGRRWSRCCR
jgi:hypothetical protein